MHHSIATSDPCIPQELQVCRVFHVANVRRARLLRNQVAQPCSLKNARQFQQPHPFAEGLWTKQADHTESFCPESAELKTRLLPRKDPCQNGSRLFLHTTRKWLPCVENFPTCHSSTELGVYRWIWTHPESSRLMPEQIIT